MITDVRHRISAMLTAEVDWPVYTFKPDSVDALPCIVVDRPSITLDVQHTVFSTSVVVLGRRDGSEDAQNELDAVAWAAVVAVSGPEFAVLRVEPATASVAEHTYPAYDLTVSCGVTVCREDK